MAWYEKREGKKGTTYRIFVSDGTNQEGRQIIRRMTWKPTPNMTPRQEEKALNRVMLEFESSIQQGFQIDNDKTFAEYADYVIKTKELAGVRPRTIDRYKELLPRINAAIGHKKIVDLRPQHLNQFYANLAEEGIRLGTERAAIRIDGMSWLKEHKISLSELSRRSRTSMDATSKFLRGKQVMVDTAKKVATAMGEDPGRLYTVTQDKTPLSTKTILEHHRLISTILAQAEKEMLIPYNPASKATPPKAPKCEPDYYQPEEVDRILDKLDTAPVKWRACTYLLIDTGCRRAEIAGLKWEDIDIDSGILTINRNLHYSSKRGIYEGPTKNGKGRVLRISEETVTVLREHLAQQDRMREIAGDRWEETGFVFTQEYGKPMNPDSITDWLNKFSLAEDLPHIHPHAFRHTAASTMIASGIDIVTTAAELGHNPATTEMYYAHVINEAKARAGAVRSSVFNRRKSKTDK